MVARCPQDTARMPHSANRLVQISRETGRADPQQCSSSPRSLSTDAFRTSTQKKWYRIRLGVATTNPRNLQASTASSPSLSKGTSRTFPHQSPPGSCRSQKKKRSNVILGLAIGMSILVVACFLLTLKAFAAVVEAKRVGLCTTPSCRSYSDMLAQSLSTSRDPCDDFYRYVCDGWIRRHAESVYEAHVRQFVQLLARELHDHVPATNQTAGQKAAALFQSCRAVVTRSVDHREEFIHILRRCGVKWPKPSLNPDVLTTSIKLYATLMLDTLLHVVRSDYNRPAIRISASAIVNRTHKRREQIMRLGGYEDYYITTRDLLSTADTRQQDLQSYKEFQRNESVILLKLRGPFNSENQSVLVQDLGELSAMTRPISQERWSHVLTTEHLYVPSDPFFLVVLNRDYLRAFSNLLNLVGEEALHLYVGWLAMQEVAIYMSLDMVTLYSGGIRYADNANIRGCLYFAENALGWALYLNYIRKSFDQSAINKIRDIAEAVALSLNARTRNVSQLENRRAIEDTTRNLRRITDIYDTIQKTNILDDIFANVRDAGPDFLTNWLDLVNATRGYNSTTVNLTRTFYMTDMQDASYYKSCAQDKWIVPPYAAMLPIFDPGVTESVQFGALGMAVGVVASEALHDTLFNSTDFQEGASCYRRVFNQTTNVNTLMDVAASLDVVWYAYQIPIRKALPMEVKGQASIPADKLFFIAMCYLWCGSGSPEDTLHRAVLCNEPLMHSRQFSEVFHCSPGSPMNAEKCSIF